MGDYLPEVIVDHPGRRPHHRRSLRPGTLLISAGPPPFERVAADPDRLLLRPVPLCCPTNARLSITLASDRISILNLGEAGWCRQVWEEPNYRPEVSRRGGTGAGRAGAGPASGTEISRLATFWLGSSTTCWRVGVVNPAGPPVDRDGLVPWGTAQGERRVPLAGPELDAVLVKYGAFLSFPAARERRVWAGDDPSPAHPHQLETLLVRAISKGFHPPLPGHDPDQLELLAFLLRTGSVSYEDLVREKERRRYRHVDLPSPLPNLP